MVEFTAGIYKTMATHNRLDRLYRGPQFPCTLFTMTFPHSVSVLLLSLLALASSTDIGPPRGHPKAWQPDTPHPPGSWHPAGGPPEQGPSGHHGPPNNALTNHTCTPENMATRKEWGLLTTTERRAYIDAVHCMINSPSKFAPGEVPGAKNRYDDFAG